jgi:hypothetical protein
MNRLARVRFVAVLVWNPRVRLLPALASPQVCSVVAALRRNLPVAAESVVAQTNL